MGNISDTARAYSDAAHAFIDENDRPYHIKDIELAGQPVGLYLRRPELSELDDFEGENVELALNKLIDLLQFRGADDDNYVPFDPTRDGKRLEPLKVLVGFKIKAAEVVPKAMAFWELDAPGKPDGETSPA